MSCPICHVRKEKRFCPALHDRICAQCCGEQRELTLDCPSECPYLQQARQHEKPRQPQDELPEEMFPAIDVRQDFLLRHEALMAGVLQTLGKLAQGDRGLRDRELIAALANMVRSYQTLIGSGLVYQQAVANPAQEAIISTLTQLFEEFRGVERQHLGYTTLKDRDVLEALVFILRLAHLHTSGRPLSRGFVDFLHERFPLAQAAMSGETQSASRIILP